MSLLPKSHEEFSQKDYWDSFFKKRGGKAFEWYGEYPELCEHLHKYIKAKDDVLVVGCGNSKLSSDLYDVGYKNITNVDISQIVIRQMQNLHEKQRPTLKYIHMDVLNMTFDNESFTVILDKGTLDALMPDEEMETVNRIEQYFNEVARVLKTGGRVIRSFEAEKNEENESSMPVFVVICTKFKNLPQKILEINLSSEDKMQRIEDVDEISKLVAGVQQAAFVCSGLRRSNIVDEEASFDLYKQGESTPRFTVHVVDVPKDHKNAQYAAFIVPQGREVEWMFATPAGRKNLANMTKHNRLAIVAMHRGQTYENLDMVQKELNDTVCSLVPTGITGKIQFLSLGSDVGSRKICYEGHSEFSGHYVVEDVEVDNKQKFRRLIYTQFPSVIQSEAKLRAVKSRKGHTKEIVDHAHLICKHHNYMCIATHLACGSKSSPTLAVVGVGGGALSMFLHKFLPQAHSTVVDIDSDMLKIASDWFGLQQNKKLEVCIMDGLEFMKYSAKAGKKFDAILFDINNVDTSVGISCPSKDFLEPGLLTDVHNCLTKTGLFILNLVLRDDCLKPEILINLKTAFSTTFGYKLEEDLNEVIICSNQKLQQTTFITKLGTSTNELNKFLKSNNLQEDDLVEVQHFMKGLKIEC